MAAMCVKWWLHKFVLGILKTVTHLGFFSTLKNFTKVETLAASGEIIQILTS